MRVFLRLSLSVCIALTLIICIYSFKIDNAKATGCVVAIGGFLKFNVDIEHDARNWPCFTSVGASGDTYVTNNNSIYENVNIDMWQTRTIGSGTHQFRSGRTGYVTYPNDGYRYHATSTNEPPGQQLNDPSYSCFWVQFNNASGPAYDNNCLQFPLKP